MYEDECVTCEQCWFGSRYDIDPTDFRCLREAQFDCTQAGDRADQNCLGFISIDDEIAARGS